MLSKTIDLNKKLDKKASHAATFVPIHDRATAHASRTNHSLSHQISSLGSWTCFQASSMALISVLVPLAPAMLSINAREECKESVGLCVAQPTAKPAGVTNSPLPVAG